MYRQIAGALAKRIVNYAKVGTKVLQGTDAGFIKFGSRVDLYLPIGTEINVKLGDKMYSLVEKNISKEDAIKNADNLLYEKAKLVIKDLNKAWNIFLKII